MSHKLINHNQDLRSLWEEGYEVEIKDAFLLVHHVPYLAPDQMLGYGTLVCNLDLAGDATLRPGTHVAQFIGQTPHHANGKAIDEIIIGNAPQRLHEDITVNLTFSSKPAIGYYDDYFHKMVTYINILASEARCLYPQANEQTYSVTGQDDETTVFNYHDTNSARGSFSAISAKVKGLKIAIVGLGGTGGYLLDFVAKTPVAEIHLFDSDLFSQHNAFRAPGAAAVEELVSRNAKVDYLAKIYSAMHKNIIPHGIAITQENLAELGGFDFVFIAIDVSAAKEPIIVYLEQQGISFIDVGMGIQLTAGQLIGVLRTTTSTPECRAHVHEQGRITFEDDNKNEYASNIQIAELNAMNAAMAVIKWKKLYGIYHDAEQEYHSTDTINESQLVNDDVKA